MFNQISDNFSESIWGNIIVSNIEDELNDYILRLENVKNKMKLFDELDKFTSVIQEDIYCITNIKNSLNNWDSAYEKYNQIKFTKWPVDKKVTNELKNDAKEIRDEIKKSFKTLMDSKFIYSSKEVYQDINSMYKILDSIRKIINEFTQRFSQKKREKNIIDFNDIEHFALQILVDIDENGEIVSSEVCKRYKEKFKEIAIDEYQDSNLVQEYILNSISSGNNVFMVGDVKQSIYKFRQARPELFLEKYNNYKLKDKLENNDNLKIQLFKNFRSRDNILNITNLVFENIMSKELGDIDYNQDEYLYLGAKYDESENELVAGKTDINIIDLKDVEDSEDDENNDFEQLEKVQIEAKFVAKKIQELIESGKMIYDKKDGYREITYKDIVVLLRSTNKSAPIFEEEISNLNIPVYSDTSSEYLNSIEIQTIMSLLRIIENPLQDIPLVTVLRSYIGGFTDNELVEIRLADKNDSFYYAMKKCLVQVSKQLREKIEEFFKKLEKWRQEEKYKPLDELIWNIYTDTGFYNYVTLMSNGKLKQANLKMLFEKAKKYESESFKGLYNFINFIDKLQLTNNDMGAAKILGENDNVVRIMSIHKSKGLEFPVVFLSQTGKSFNMQDLNEPILLHQDLGFGPKYIDAKRRIEYNTLAKEAIKIKSKQENIAEEMRILYVALTRAKEKLIITGTSNDAEKDLKKKRDLIEVYGEKEGKINKNIIGKYKKYLDWLELVFLYNDDAKQICNLEIIDKGEIPIQSHEEIEKLEIRKNKNISLESKIKERLEWKYEYENITDIPVKSSVTKIKQDKQEEHKIIMEIPKFMKETEKVSQARKGTLMHLCIQKLNNKKEYTKEMVNELVEDLQKNDIITQIEKESININKLYEFTKSKLFKELRQAKQVYNEQPFYINISAKQIEDQNPDEPVLVQGIIDLYYINREGKLILVDYKTDYVKTGEELVNKYSEQLKLYKLALEKSLSKKVDRTIIYSLYLNKEIEVKF